MKPFVLFVFCALLSSTYSQDLSNGLLVHYNFVNGEAIDLSGNNYDGIVNATPIAGMSGDSYTAFSFNGENEYIDLPNSSVLKPNLPVTISATVRLNTNSFSSTSIFTNDFEKDNHTGVWINTSSQGMFAANFGDNTGGTSPPNRRSKIGTTVLNVDEWYVLTAVIRGANDMDLYVNCQNDGGHYAGSGGSLGYSNKPGSLGRKDSHFSAPAYYLNGTIDEFRFWNRELSQNEILVMCRTLNDVSIELPKSKYEIQVFPNPSNDIISIQTSYNNDVNVEIYSMQGKLVLQSTELNNIDISNIENGQYIIKLKTPDNNAHISVTKFVKI